MTGPAAWYAYGQPYDWSANTGFEVSHAAVFYFIISNTSKVQFVQVNDQPYDWSPGSMGIVIDSPNLANRGVDIDFYDDAEGLYWEANRNSTACLADDSVSDCFSWDDDAGYFSGRWAWGGCCTDGWGFGPLPETGFDFNVKSVDAGEYKTYGMDWALFGES